MAEIALPLMGQGDDLYDEIIRENLSKRILIFNENVTDAVIENYILYILKWNREDKEAGIPKESRRKITLIINSAGGDAFSGFNFVDCISQSTTPIRAICMSMAASMAYHIFICCPERYAFQNSVLLQHDGELTLQNSTSKVRDTMRFFEDMERRTKEHVLKYTKMTEEFYDSHYDQEYWMYANDKGKELGCVDYIIGEDCILDDIL